MQEPGGLQQPQPTPDFEPGHAYRSWIPTWAATRRRSLLPLAIIAIALGLLAYHTTTATGPIQPTTQLSTAPITAPIENALKSQLEARAPTPVPAPTPIPTPDPSIRPLSVAVASPAVNHGPAPVRKPGTPDPNPSTDHVIVVDGDSGAVLFQRNAYEPVAPASLTKIMTATLGIEHGILSDHVKVDVDAGSMPESSLMGLEPWFDVTFQDLLYGLMLPSGNDAALAIARYVAGSDEKFVRLMNEKAASLGLHATHFSNPHGLDQSDHYSCPADMVTMARYAMQYPLFRQVVASRTYDVRESNVSYTLYNVNPLLGSYPPADGVKTGDTDSAGKALVGTAVMNGHRVYVAFMRSDNGAAADGSLLLNWAFTAFDWPQ